MSLLLAFEYCLKIMELKILGISLRDGKLYELPMSINLLS